jgi:hypothetical protein
MTFKTLLSLGALATAIAAVPALAHPHKVGRNGQVIANGQNHPAFVMGEDGFVSCEDYTLLPGFGPAWYGLETAHHGPDATGRGKSDGCYQIEDGLSPLNPLSDRNPAID